jgi:hypothetical protein
VRNAPAAFIYGPSHLSGVGPTPWRPPYPSPAPHRSPETIIGGVLSVVAFLVIAGIGLSMMGGFPGSTFGVFPIFACLPILFVIVIIVVVLFQAGSHRRTIPPPPPIQQPMVPAGQQGPVAVDCPNCGGPPTNVDRFGIATCAYCGTRYLVR